MKKRILISSYAISPVKGSEFGSAWNTVVHLAMQHELWVLYGISDAHMGDTQTMRGFLNAGSIPNVHFIEVQPGFIANTINLLNKAGLGWFFYFAYYLWQKQALKCAQKLIETVDIDVVHQLGPIGYREPGFLWKLGKPMVWGPIGGMMTIDRRLLKNKPLITQIKFNLKNLINRLQLGYSLRIKKAFKEADVLIAATRTGQQTIMNRFGRDSHYLPDTSFTGDILLDESKFNNENLQFVWSGSHIERKNLTLCLDALAATKNRNWTLNVLGSGPLTVGLKNKAAALGLTDNIVWHGQMNRVDAVKVMAASHLHIVTSIAEDNPAVIFEAMGCGVPSLTIDHHGMADVVCDKCGAKIQVDEYPVMVKSMTGIIENWLLNPQLLYNLACTTVVYAADFQWDKRLAKLNGIYNKAIAAREKRLGYVLSDSNLIAL